MNRETVCKSLLSYLVLLESCGMIKSHKIRRLWEMFPVVKTGAIVWQRRPYLCWVVYYFEVKFRIVFIRKCGEKLCRNVKQGIENEIRIIAKTNALPNLVRGQEETCIPLDIAYLLPRGSSWWGPIFELVKK